MMPMYFTKPESALTRAREFIDVDKKDSALEVLNYVIRSKKHRQWSETHEVIMRQYLELCVDMQRSAVAKDGLYQYRNICKDANLDSFRKVLDGFLVLAEKKASDAREQSQQTVLDVEDLDAVQTPENLMLSTVSGEDTQDRTDRVLLTPWVKFLWESFRQILELLKNNYLMEKIYADVAKRAFWFCLEYKRRTEFRKLCDILRNHLKHAQEHQSQQYSLKLDSPDTIQILVEIRFEQLEKSISIDLWQEAFKAIEEIHNLIGLNKQKAKASLLENFYHKQASVYWMANNKLFHAAALHRLFVLRKEQKKTFDTEEAQRTGAQVLLATLAIPIVPVASEIDRFLVVDYNLQDRSRRLSNLLRLNSPPTRASLLKELSRQGVLQCISPELQQLYNLLEVEYNPLQLCSRVQPLLETIGSIEGCQQYVESLKEVTLVRLVKQISQVYQSIQLDRLAKLALFATPTELEKIVVVAAKTNGIPVRIDHHTNSFWFGTDVSFSHEEEGLEGPVVQAMPSEVLSTHLCSMAAALHQAARIVFAHEIELKQAQTCQLACQLYKDNELADHKAVLRRKKAVEERKEFIEKEREEKESLERAELEKKEEERRKLEQEKLDRDKKEREEEVKKKEIEEMKRKMAEEKLEALKKTGLGARAFADVTADDLQDLDPNAIMVKQLKQMDKERKEKDIRLKTQEKKIDYMERAKRIMEIPKLEKQYEEQIQSDRLFHEQEQEEKVTSAIKEREEAVATKGRLDHMQEGKEEFMKVLSNKHTKEYQAKLAEFDEMLELEKVKRLDKRRLERKQRRKAEEIARKKTEKERKIRELAEAERARVAEEQRKKEEELERIRQKQLLREQEVEERRQRREKEASMRQERDTREERYSRKDEGDSWRKPASEDSWRQRDDDRDRRDYDDRYAPPSRRDEPYRPTRRYDEHDSWRRRDDADRDRDRRDQGWRSERGEREEYRRYGERDRRGESDWRDRDQDRDRGRDYDRGYRARDRDHYRERDSYRDSDRGPYRDQDRYRDRERESGYREKDRRDMGTWRRSPERDRYDGDRDRDYPPHRDDRQDGRGGDWRSRRDSPVRRGREDEGSGWERVHRRR